MNHTKNDVDVTKEVPYNLLDVTKRSSHAHDVSYLSQGGVAGCFNP